VERQTVVSGSEQFSIAGSDAGVCKFGRRSSAAVQGFCKAKVGSSILSAGTMPA
jgi:hypothetical protein